MEKQITTAAFSGAPAVGKYFTLYALDGTPVAIARVTKWARHVLTYEELSWPAMLWYFTRRGHFGVVAGSLYEWLAARAVRAFPKWVSIVVLFAALNASLAAQSISGRVYSASLSPIAGARVIAMQGSDTWVAVTDETGRYDLALPRYGRYTLTAIAPRDIFDYQRLRLRRPISPCEGEFCFPIDATPVNLVGHARP